MAPGVSAPVRSVLGVSAQPGVAWPGVSPVLNHQTQFKLSVKLFYSITSSH